MFLNKSALRKHILNRWEKLRGHQMTRVSNDTFDNLESRLINLIDKLIIEHPSTGKTIMFEPASLSKL